MFFGSLALLALGLKFFTIPGSAFLVVLSLSCLAMLYFYLGFALLNNIPLRKIVKKESYKEISALRIFGAIIAGISLSQTVVGILFAAFKWQGATILLATGLIGLALILIIGFVKYAQSKSTFYPKLFGRIAMIGSVGLILLMV